MSSRSVVAKTPQELCAALELPLAAADEWKVQYELLKRLRGAMERTGVTDAELAARAGVSLSSVKAVLSGSGSTDLLNRLLSALA